MKLNRREALKSSILLASASAFAPSVRNLNAETLFESSKSDLAGKADKLRTLIIEHAKSLGCDFVDCRFTYLRDMSVQLLTRFTAEESLIMGVRILVNGYWGYCCTPEWDEKNALHIVRLAHQQALGNSKGPPREIDSSVFQQPDESGEWIMPVKHDPFERNPYEFMDYLWGAFHFISRFPDRTALYRLSMNFNSLENWYGSSNGAVQYQKMYLSSGNLGFELPQAYKARFDIELPKAGVGYELFTDKDHFSRLREGLDEARELSRIPPSPVDIGRFPIVLTGAGTGAVMSGSIASAVELDRILGYEANAGGTSYIQDPVSEAGSLKLGTSLLNIDSNRDEPGGAATRRWDDEGSTTVRDSIIRNGVLNKVLTDKEMSNMAPGKTIGGNATSTDARFPIAVRPGNMVMRHDSSDTTRLSDLIGDIDKGLYFRSAGFGLDYQLIDGMITGEVFGINKGKLVSRLLGAGCMFKSTEIWKNLVRLGGTPTVVRTGAELPKGEPATSMAFSVTAPAAVLEEVAVIDITRKL